MLRRVRGQAEAAQDLVAHDGGRGGGAGEDARGGKLGEKAADLKVFRPEVVPPAAPTSSASRSPRAGRDGRIHSRGGAARPRGRSPSPGRPGHSSCGTVAPHSPRPVPKAASRVAGTAVCAPRKAPL